MTALVVAVLLALSPEEEARRQVAVAVATIQNYAEQRHLTKFCLAQGSEDPGEALLKALRAQHLEPTPASGCEGKGARGLLLTYEASSVKKKTASTSVEAASLPGRERLGQCLYSFTWRSDTWQSTEAPTCSGY